MNIVAEYLALFYMRCYPTKTIVVTNTDTSSSTPRLSINGALIKKILGKTDIFRFLGCFWTLNGTHTKTIQTALAETTSLIRLSMQTYLPRPVGIQLYLNSVVIPILQYRLQFSSIRPGQYEQVEIKLIEATRSTQLPDYFRAVQTLLTSLGEGKDHLTRKQDYSPQLRVTSPDWLKSNLKCLNALSKFIMTL